MPARVHQTKLNHRGVLALRVLATVAFCGAASVGAAQEVSDCDWQARADGIVEPWEDHTQTFASGNVRLALLDTVEPAAGAFYILALSPPFDELGGRQCKTLGFGGGVGFSGVDFATLNASYDPAVGLVFTAAVAYFDDGEFPEATLVFSLNQATGEIEAWLE